MGAFFYTNVISGRAPSMSWFKNGYEYASRILTFWRMVQFVKCESHLSSWFSVLTKAPPTAQKPYL